MQYFESTVEVRKELETKLGDRFDEVICRDLAHQLVNEIPLNHLKDIFNFSRSNVVSFHARLHFVRVPIQPIGMISVKKELPLLHKRVIIWYKGVPMIGQLFIIRDGELAWSAGVEIPFYDKDAVSGLSVEYWKHI